MTRLLVLVIADPSAVCEAFKKSWLLNKHPNVDVYFVYCAGRSETESRMDGQDIVCATECDECLFPGIHRKTILAEQMLLQRQNWTHLLRTNMSSFFVWETTLAMVEGMPAGAVSATPCHGLLAVVKGTSRSVCGTWYPTGCGTFMSRDVVERVAAVAGKGSPYWGLLSYDDQVLGLIMAHLDLTLTPWSFDVFDGTEECLETLKSRMADRDPTLFHVRCRNDEDRARDARAHTEMARVAASTYARDITPEEAASPLGAADSANR